MTSPDRFSLLLGNLFSQPLLVGILIVAFIAGATVLAGAVIFNIRRAGSIFTIGRIFPWVLIVPVVWAGFLITVNLMATRALDDVTGGQYIPIALLAAGLSTGTFLTLTIYALTMGNRVPSVRIGTSL